MISGSVSVPNDYFFKTAQRDYQDPTRSFLREFLQNSRDAGATRIDLEVTADSVHCVDNGCGMDNDTIQGKLLALGESGKGDGTIGGFGVAKILIFFAHHSYRIRTRDLLVEGTGGAWTITAGHPYVQGTDATVMVNKELVKAFNLERAFREEIARSHLPGVTIILNGRIVAAERRRGQLAMEIGTAVKIFKRRLPKGVKTDTYLVRVKGLHMFSLYQSDLKHEVIVELTGYSTEILTTNRDGLRGDLQRKVAEAVQGLAANSIDTSTQRTTFWKGRTSRTAEIAVKVKRLADVVSKLATKEEVAQAVRESDFEPAVAAALAASVEKLPYLDDHHFNTDALLKELKVSLSAVMAHHYFVLTRGKYRKPPAKWSPENFTVRQTALLELWAKVVAMALADADRKGMKFDVGFIIDDETSGEDAPAAMHKTQMVDGEKRHIFLLNPRSYGDEKKLPGLRTKALILYLLDCAAHEAAHIENGGHNESFVKEEGRIRFRALKHLDDYLALRKAAPTNDEE